MDNVTVNLSVSEALGAATIFIRERIDNVYYEDIGVLFRSKEGTFVRAFDGDLLIPTTEDNYDKLKRLGCFEAPDSLVERKEK